MRAALLGLLLALSAPAVAIQLGSAGGPRGASGPTGATGATGATGPAGPPGPPSSDTVTVNAPLSGDGSASNPVQMNGSTVTVSPPLSGDGSASNPVSCPSCGASAGTVTANAPILGNGSGSSPLFLDPSSVTLQGNTFNGPNELTLLNASGWLGLNGFSSAAVPFQVMGDTNGFGIWLQDHPGISFENPFVYVDSNAVMGIALFRDYSGCNQGMLLSTNITGGGGEQAFVQQTTCPPADAGNLKLIASQGVHFKAGTATADFLTNGNLTLPATVIFTQAASHANDVLCVLTGGGVGHCPAGLSCSCASF